MARVVAGTGVFFPEIKALARELRDFPRATRRKYMKAAFNAAAKVGKTKLKQITPRGPTGNLKKSVVSKANQNYGLAGYGKLGPRQGLVEFGTKPRKTTGRFASTFKSKTAGRGGQMQILRTGNGIRTKSPNFPKSFFKSAAAGKKVDLKRMPVGGRLGKPPVRTAFEQSQGGMKSVLQKQLATAYERASKDLARNFPPKGTT